MIKDFNWDEIKKSLQNAIKLEKDHDNLTILITVLEENLKENQFIGNFIRNEIELKNSLQRYLGRQSPLNCDIEINNTNKKVSIQFFDDGDYNEVFILLNDIFFGDYLKDMIEAMMGAFGRMFGKEDDF